MFSVIKRWARPGILFLVGLGFQMTGFQNVWVGYGLWIGAGIWALIMLPPIRNRIAFLKERGELTQDGILKIEVHGCNVLDFFPQPESRWVAIWGHMNIVEAEVKFYPKGEIRLRALELHMDRHTFNAKRLPVIILDHDDTYPTEFEVPNKILTGHFEGKSKKAYIRAIYDDRDCRSGEFPIGSVYERK